MRIASATSLDELRSLPGFSRGPQWRNQVQLGRTLATQARQTSQVLDEFGRGTPFLQVVAKKNIYVCNPVSGFEVFLMTLQNL